MRQISFTPLAFLAQMNSLLRKGLLSITAILIMGLNAQAQSWTTVNLIDFNNLTYESDYATNGIAYYDNAVSPPTGPRNGLINGSWEVSNTNLGATQAPLNAAGGRFLMYWTDNQYAATAPAGNVFSKTYTGLTIGKTYRYSFRYGFLLQSGNSGTNAPTLSIHLNGSSVASVPTLSTSWAKMTYTFVATATSHTLSIYNSNTTTDGNDLGLDDILLEVQQSALPVSLLHFEVSQEAGKAILTWSTASEQHNKGFEIERSTNAKDWYPVDFVASQADNGNSSTLLDYRFTDGHPLSGINYYRFKQTDIEGTYTYSPIKSLSFTNSATISLYPNPAADKLSVAGLSGTAHIDIFDLSGKRVLSAEMSNQLPVLNIQAITPGLYVAALSTAEGQVSLLKFIKN
ncbi:hypothetical protein DBR32_13660 [Taibaiella sp. KBW10]|uniref:T9SS type A sorting domain-containing protein n=1 Tax=Taibaiella sp. KBW10 TaxID=2153357 RepID=UPI000F59FE96|nr:T9SS type A sorting domain-containing protein [Taibaiella sp. KBW10]RQO29956.1 hypothetical protein DBR32_13660 [Taibaiella sp. KBW10]